MVGALALGAGAMLEACRRPSADRGSIPAADDGRDAVAIVGAGIAGLTAAHHLRKAGISAEIYEAGARAGGRIFTLRDIVAPGLWTEAGGEFIDGSHADMLALAREFNLETQDMRGKEYAGLREFAFHFGGRHRSEKEVAGEARHVAARIKGDMTSLPEAVRAGAGGAAAALDALSLEEYLHRKGVTGWFRDLLVTAYVGEFGLDGGSQSCLNFLTLVSFDLEGGRFAIFGESDERYRIAGGNQGVTDALAKSLETSLRFNHSLEALDNSPDGGYRLTFRSAGRSAEVRRNAVILALPFSTLRAADIRVELPPLKRKAISELGYGTNAKLFLGYSRRPWRAAGYSGYFFADGMAQSGWDHTLTQPGDAAGLTVFQGGAAGLALAEDSPQVLARSFAPSIEALYPGSRAAFNGNAAGFNWPAHPQSRGSYACYKVGQWTAFSGEERKPVGNLFFAGEHCSTEFQGYMNGGAATGREAAEAIIAKKKKAMG